MLSVIQLLLKSMHIDIHLLSMLWMISRLYG